MRHHPPIVTRAHAVTLSFLAASAAVAVACADEFSSCEDTLTCEPEAGAGGSAGDMAAGSGGTISDAGVGGGDSRGGTGAASPGGASGEGGEGPTVGDECVDEGATLCDAADDGGLLRCTDGAWKLGTCDAGFVCASELAVCTPIAEGCEERVAGEAFCSENVLRVCGPDRTMITEQTCDGRCFVDTCLPVGCGDGLLRDGEACDDGNDVAGDGCSGCEWEPVGIKAMAHHTCAWFENGSLKCWGRNDAGQLGLGDTEDRGKTPGELWSALPDVPLAGVTAVAGSLKSTCAIARGAIHCWGGNEVGELASGNAVGVLLPVRVQSPHTFVSIEASADGTYCAVRADGPLLCWGKNDAGQTGRGLGPAISSSFVNIGDSPGELARTPSGPDISQVTSLSFGFDFACVVGDGGLRCWGGRSLDGSRTNEIFGDAPEERRPTDVNLGPGFTPEAVAVAAGAARGCALSTTGTIKCWGTTYSGTTALGYGNADGVDFLDLATVASVDIGGPAQQIASGRFFTCALLVGGALKCWGRSLDPSSAAVIGDALTETGMNLPPLELDESARSITAGLDHACALLENGSVACWGSNQYGQLGTGVAPVTQRCPIFGRGLLRDPSHSMENTCCQWQSLGRMEVSATAGLLRCEPGATPTR